VAFTIFYCALLMLFAAPAWAQGDQCSGALGFPDAQHLGSATGCGVLITVNSDGTANVAIVGNGNPYDGSEDTLVGIQNNSGGSFNSITLSAPITANSPIPIFALDGDGPCFYNGNDCFGGEGRTGYEGPNNTFTNISTDKTTGTVTFTTPLANGTSTWFALEGAPSAVTVGAISQSQTLTFNPGTNVQQQATFDCGPMNENGACSSPNAHSVKMTYDQVNSPFSVQINVTEVDGDGVCPIPAISRNANDNVPTDNDCTLANFFGSTLPSYASYPYLMPVGTGSVNTPFCLPYAGGGTKCAEIEVIVLPPATGNETIGFLHLYFAWNFDTNALFALAPPGRYVNYPQLYDAPHNDQDTVDYPPAPKGYPYPGTNTDLQKVFLVSRYYNVNGIAGLDGGVGTGPPTGVRKPNHYIVAFPFAAPDSAEWLFSGLPQRNSTNTCYPKGLPMLVAFEIEKGEQQDPNVLKPSHPLGVTVLQNGVFQNVGNPTVQHLFGTIYYVFLSNANLPVNSATNPYQLQLSTDLISVPLTQNFLVQNSCF